MKFDNDSPLKAVVVVVAVALVCSIMVSGAAIALRPIQQKNQLVEKSRNIVALSGLVDAGAALSSDDILAAVEQLDRRIIDISSGEFDDTLDPLEFDSREAVGDAELGIAVPPELDQASLGRRSRYEVVHLVWEDGALRRVILPIWGQGMWSTLYGYVALEADLNTIGAATFYEQAETAGLGDQITNQSWLVLWEGRQIYGSGGDLRFRIAAGPVVAGSPAANYEVDGLTGATVTGNAVTRIVRYWFGPDGYGPFLERLRDAPPTPTLISMESSP